MDDKRRIADKLTEVVAFRLYQFEVLDKRGDLDLSYDSYWNKYRSDPIFHRKVCCMVSDLMVALDECAKEQRQWTKHRNT